MLAVTNSASRRADRYFQSGEPELPAASVRGLVPARASSAPRAACSRRPARDACAPAPDTTDAGRSPGRRMESSPSAAAHTGHVSSDARDHAGGRATRAERLVPAAQPIEGDHAREVHHRVLAAERPLRAAHRAPRSPMSHDAGGSTTSIACLSRQKRAAIISVLRPTSCSRVSGGMHSRLKSVRRAARTCRCGRLPSR